MTRPELSARVFHRVLKVARTIAGLAGEGKAIRGSYEDSVEALSRLISSVCQLATQRLGERNAQKAILSPAEALAQSARITLYGDFDLASFVRKIVGA